MKKKFLLSVLGVLCSHQVFGEQTKKLTDKEFIIKKNRNESLQGIQKPKSLIINSDDQKFIPYDFRFDDLNFEVKALPINLNLIDKEKKNRRLRHNLIRLGAGWKNKDHEPISFDHVADVFLKKKIGDFSGHLIFRSKTPKAIYFNGWKEIVQFFTEYSGVDFCKPFFVFNQGWKNFERQEEGSVKKIFSSNLDLDFKLGCPIIIEKGEYKPDLSFRHSNFAYKKDDKEHTFTEKEFDLNLDCGFEVIDNIKFSCDAKVKKLYYDKKSKIYNFNGPTLKELDDESEVTFIKTIPKIGFVFNNVEISPKLCFDYCSNKNFVKSDNTNFALGVDVGYEFKNKVNVNLFINEGLKPNTFHKIYKHNRWGEHQAIVASNNKWEVGVKANTQIFSNFRFNAGLKINSYDVLPHWCSKESLKYIEDVKRYKGNIGVLYEFDRCTILVSTSFSKFQHAKQDQEECRHTNKFKTKCDVSYDVTERLLMHAQGSISNVLYFVFGANYVYSDLLTFFGNCGTDIIRNAKVVFGICFTPDKWIEKDFSNQLV